MTKSVKICPGCITRTGDIHCKPAGERVCPYCGYDEVTDPQWERQLARIDLLFTLETLIVVILTLLMTLFMMAVVWDEKDRLGRMFDSIARFITFCDYGRLEETLDCCAILLCLNALAAGWFFIHQYVVNNLGDSNRMPVSFAKIRFLAIVGAFHIICVVAVGILIFYVEKFL